MSIAICTIQVENYSIRLTAAEKEGRAAVGEAAALRAQVLH